MEICPKCKHLSAELNHYTNLIVCYNRACGFEEKKECEHDWRKVCWTNQAITYGCPKCEAMKIEILEEGK